MKENLNKSLILKIVLIILLIVVIIGGIYLLVSKTNKDSKNGYIVVYLKDEYKESNITDIKKLRGVKNASYTSNKDLYNKLKERVKIGEFSLLFTEEDFGNIIVVEIKNNSNKKIIEDINKLGFAEKSVYAENVYEQVVMNLASYAMYLKLDISDEEFDKVYNFVKSIDGVYDVKKVTKEDALNLAKGQLGKDADKVIAEYEKSNPFTASVTFKVSNMNDFDRIENEVKSYMEDNEIVTRYNTNTSTIKTIIDELHKYENEQKDK